MPLVAVSKILREKLTDEGVSEFIAILKEVEEDARKDSLVVAEERFERRLSEEASKLDKRITEEASKLDKRITEEASKLDKRITEEVAKLDKRITEEVSILRLEMANSKAEIIKWMFLFWIGQIVVVAGLIKFIR